MFEIDFLPVGAGNGDAICIRYGNDQTGHFVHVVDGGFADTTDTIVRHIETHYGKGWFINHMVLTHADNDHATGHVGVLKGIVSDRSVKERRTPLGSYDLVPGSGTADVTIAKNGKRRVVKDVPFIAGTK